MVLLTAALALTDAHRAGAWVAIAANGIVGGWALAAHRWPALRRPALWAATVVAQVAMFAQVVLGVVMVAGDDRPVDQFHMFYGFVALVAIAIIYSYRLQMAHRLHLLYGLGGLFVMGLGLRALFLA